MNASQSMPSPISPYDGQSKQSFSAPRPYYPATPAPESVSPQQQQQQQQPVEPNRGLGLTYPGSMAPSHPPTISPVMPSPQSDWSQSQQQPQSSSAAPPDIFSAEFDPFSGFPATSNHGMVGSHSPEAPGLEFCHTPPSSNMQSHRGSVSSSCAPSEASDQAYTPRPMKGEETWYPVSSNQAPLQYPHGAVPLATHNDDIIYRPHPDWTKPDGAHFSDPQATQDGRLPPPLGMLASVTRQKKKRQRTTPEEATHECQVCGKLFKRSYNYKSHLDTHNPERKYPHPCTCMVGNSQCAKKFQRKTDLDRHVDSVSSAEDGQILAFLTITGTSQSSESQMSPVR
ncbi:MAG: hypothetical protein MMC23_007787 [Stictis urceolatum]|nr:hypothetical protein [Stictis urceolata]